MINDEGIPRAPSSPARLAANRRNAQQSTGPRNKSGKRRVGLNALRLGFAPPEIARQLEARHGDPRDFRRLHRDVADFFPPQGMTGEASIQVGAGAGQHPFASRHAGFGDWPESKPNREMKGMGNTSP